VRDGWHFTPGKVALLYLMGLVLGLALGGMLGPGRWRWESSTTIVLPALLTVITLATCRKRGA
jgi:hypothetical protein